jgi:hypothetical protein
MLRQLQPYDHDTYRSLGKHGDSGVVHHTLGMLLLKLALPSSVHGAYERASLTFSSLVLPFLTPISFTY